MAPDMLISISNLSHDEITRMGNLLQNCESFCRCFPGASAPLSGKHKELIERLTKNFGDYHNSLLTFGKQELIDMADKVSAMSTLHSYMSYRGFEDEELDFLLQFQNPLEVAADYWLDYTQDMNDELGNALDVVFGKNDLVSIDKEDLLASYPLVKDSETLTGNLAEMHEPETSPPKQAAKLSASKTKPSLMERLAEAGAEAKAYNAQRGQNPANITKNNKKEID